MNVYVLGVALNPPTSSERRFRLEEMTYRSARAALDAAGVARRQLDSLTLGGCDERDGRPISSMLMSAPAGGYNVDEIKVTDSGATALCLAYARFAAGDTDLGLVVSWCKSSKADVEAVMLSRAEPFFTRPIGIGGMVSDALLAQAVVHEFGVGPAEATRRVLAGYSRAARNVRGMAYTGPTAEAVDESSM